MVAELKEVILRVAQLEDGEQRRIAKMLEDEVKFESFLQELKPDSKYDEAYLKSLRDKAKKSWLGTINPDEWLKRLRGGYDS